MLKFKKYKKRLPVKMAKVTCKEINDIVKNDHSIDISQLDLESIYNCNNDDLVVGFIVEENNRYYFINYKQAKQEYVLEGE